MTIKEKHNKFLEIYLPVQDNLWRYSLFMTRNRELAKELLAETIAKAYTSFDKIKSEQAFLSYLFTIASRTFYAQCEKKKVENFVECDFENLFITNNYESADYEELYDNLNKLPREQRETLILFYIEGFSRKELANIQNISEETVKSRLARGKKTMAKLMGAQLEYED